MFSAEECQLIIEEASPHVDPIRVRASSCRAWKIPHQSVTAGLLIAYGYSIDQAQVVRYGVGGSYDWHDDGKNRKFTTVIPLSSPADYDGGTLEFAARGGPLPVSTKRGVPLKFSAGLSHRVTEVTRGERWSLVVWS